MEHSVFSNNSSAAFWSKEDVGEAIKQDKIILFCRGDKIKTKCGFSGRIVSALEKAGCSYKVVDVVSNKSASAALREFAGNAQVPKLYINGKLVNPNETRERMSDLEGLCNRIKSTLAT